MKIPNLGYKRCNDLLLRRGTKRSDSRGEETANKGREMKEKGRENVKDSRQKRRNCRYLRCAQGPLLSKIGYTHDKTTAWF